MSTLDGYRPIGGGFRDDWLAPELIGVDMTAATRTANHDNFALAALIFRLLMLGRDPFVGAWIGPAPTAAEAVANHAFVYAPTSTTRPPPGAPLLAALPNDVAGLFEEAFSWGGRQARPSAGAWQKALRRLSRNLRVCAADPAHVYGAHLDLACPWCALAGVLGGWPPPSVPRPAPTTQGAPSVARGRRQGISWPARVQVICAVLALGCAAGAAWLLGA
jgi:DNA-binding helix-hairpin-helix protein with protein kinase domain